MKAGKPSQRNASQPDASITVNQPNANIGTQVNTDRYINNVHKRRFVGLGLLLILVGIALVLMGLFLHSSYVVAGLPEAKPLVYQTEVIMFVVGSASLLFGVILFGLD